MHARDVDHGRGEPERERVPPECDDAIVEARARPWFVALVASKPPAQTDRTNGPEERALTVAELGRRMRGAIERATTGVSVEGEVGSTRHVDSGHTYFTLRDEREDASVDCVLYRSGSVRARRLVQDGARLVLTGQATFWVPRGRVQLVVEAARPAGRGALLEALRELTEKLRREGLFAPERKRPVPRDPRVIGLVTSAQGAALHDVIKVAFARGGVRLVVAPARVQGEGAAAEMARSIRKLEKHPEVSVILLARGGGSSDDLSGFNDEALVRTMAACRVPVVSAVGHEVDVTLADLVADFRAATPSQAAELLVPDMRARRQSLGHLKQRLGRSMRRVFDERQQRVDVLRADLEVLARRWLATRRDRLSRLERRVGARHPASVLAAARAEVAGLEGRMAAAIRARVTQAERARVPEERLLGAMARRAGEARALLAELGASLHALSPLAVLSRGYAIVERRDTGAIVRAVSDVAPRDRISIRVEGGRIAAVVDEPASEAEPERSS